MVQVARAVVQNIVQVVAAVVVQEDAQEVVEQSVNQVVQPTAQVDVMEIMHAESVQVYVQDAQTCVMVCVDLAVTVAVRLFVQVVLQLVIVDAKVVTQDVRELVQVVALVDAQMAVKELVMVNV